MVLRKNIIILIVIVKYGGFRYRGGFVSWLDALVIGICSLVLGKICVVIE